MHRNTAWLSRDFGSTCPHAEQRCDVIRSRHLHHPRPAVAGRRGQRQANWCHPLARMARLSPDFALTLWPGCSRVPFAERVICLVFRFSSTTTAFAGASRWAVWAQKSSRRAPPAPAISASADRTLSRLRPRRAARESLRCSRTARRLLAGGEELPVEQLHRRWSPALPPRRDPHLPPLSAQRAHRGSESVVDEERHEPMTAVTSQRVAERSTTSSSGRDKRNRTQPSFGSFTRAWRPVELLDNHLVTFGKPERRPPPPAGAPPHPERAMRPARLVQIHQRLL